MNFHVTKNEWIFIVSSLLSFLGIILFLAFLKYSKIEQKNLIPLSKDFSVFQCNFDITKYHNINDIITLKINSKETKALLISTAWDKNNNCIIKLRFLESLNVYKIHSATTLIKTTNKTYLDFLFNNFIIYL